MKMTMHIDEALLERVMREYEFPSKTETVEAALKELDRQMRFREFRKHGLGLTPEELADSVYPDYDPDALRGRGYARKPEAMIEDGVLAEPPPAPYNATRPTHGPTDTR
jgi:hypothetical protein